MKILKSQALASCNTEDVTVMESRVSVSNFTPPPMVMVLSLYVTYSFFVFFEPFTHRAIDAPLLSCSHTC